MTIYPNNKGFAESRGRSKSVILGRDEVSYEKSGITKYLQYIKCEIYR
jgi:hypothetical protein